MKKTYSVNQAIFLSLIGIILLLSGCSSDIPDSPDGTVRAVIDGLKKNEAHIVWKALPESYQNDLNKVTHDFANKMDEELYNKSFSLINQIILVLKDKKEFIFNSPLLANNPNIQKNKTKIDKEWHFIIEAMETITKSDVSELATLKDINVGNYMENTGNELMAMLSSFGQLATKESQTKSYNDITDIKLLSSENDHAVVNITFNNDSSENLRMTRIEGRWIPSDLAAEWKANIDKAKKAIADISSEQIAQGKIKAIGAMSMVEASVSQLAKAKDQSEFNQATQNTMLTILGLGFVN